MATPLPGTPHTARIAFMYTIGLQECENVFYLEDTTDAMFADVNATLTDLDAAWDTNMMPLMYTTADHVATEFEDVRTLPFAGVVRPVSPQVAGTLTITGELPNSVSIAIKKSTGNLGRGGRGRLYWPLFDESNLVGGNTAHDTYVNAVVTALEAFQADVESSISGAKLGIVSYWLAKVIRTAGLFQQITDFGVSDYIVDNQRRRLPGRGR